MSFETEVQHDYCTIITTNTKSIRFTAENNKNIKTKNFDNLINLKKI